MTATPVDEPRRGRAGGPGGGGPAAPPVAPPVDDRRLDALRAMCDPPADKLAERLRRGHEGIDEREVVRLVLRALVDGPPDDDGPLKEWMCDGPPLPPWADAARIARGQAFFADWALPISALLYCASLPSAYAAADGVQVLALTSDLATKDLTRRIAETGQMVIDVMDVGHPASGTLAPGGQGYLTVRGVRLLHAVVRQAILTSPDVSHTCDESVARRWCPEWGQPVNQEDLLGTLLTFTVSVFHGLDRLGIPYDPAAAGDYLHAWCVVGALLGIDGSLLPLDRDGAEALAETIARRHHRSSDAGRRLMDALLADMEHAMPRGLRGVPRTLVRQVVTPSVVESLDLPPAAWWGRGLDLLRRLGPLAGRVPGVRRAMQAPSELVGRSMMRYFVDRSMLGLQAPFRLDAAAAAQLSLATSARRRQRRHRRIQARARHAHAHTAGGAR